MIQNHEAHSCKHTYHDCLYFINTFFNPFSLAKNESSPIFAKILPHNDRFSWIQNPLKFWRYLFSFSRYCIRKSLVNIFFYQCTFFCTIFEFFSYLEPFKKYLKNKLVIFNSVICNFLWIFWLVDKVRCR